MSERNRRILLSFSACESRKDTYAWKETVAEKLIDLAEVSDDAFSRRAVCPLCGRGPDTPYETGFTVPIGLSRHLIGWGQVRECIVVAAASALAQEHWNGKFSKAECEANRNLTTKVAQRKNQEEMYVTSPGAAPLLLDEGLRFGRTPRNKEQMSRAENRLRELDFQIQTVDNVRSYVDDQGEIVVYADPRGSDEIEFRAYRCSAPKSTKSRAKLSFLGTFLIPDRWKNDLKKKYDKWRDELRVAK